MAVNKRTQNRTANELNIGKMLRERPELYAGRMLTFDEFSGRTMLNEPIPRPGLPLPPPHDPREFTDVDTIHLMEWFQANGMPKVSQARVAAAVMAEAHRNRYSSAQAKLAMLPKWDGELRLDKFWITVCGAQCHEEGMSDDECFARTRYLHATARCFFISIVARIEEPGCKVDTLPILEGPQGSLKSTLLRVIALGVDEFFSENLPHDITKVDAKAHLRGKMIVELSEINQFRTSRIDILKAFLTVRYDQMRLPYGYRDSTFYRQCVFVGTTNDDDYLSDITGNRRFWPIACGHINIELARQIMPLLYAEALVAYRAGEKHYLDEDVEIIAAYEQRQRLPEDAWDGAIENVVTQRRKEAVANGKCTFWVTTNEAIEAVDIKVERQDRSVQMRVATVLVRFGGVRRKLPRGGGWPKRGYEFEVGTVGTVGTE